LIYGSTINIRELHKSFDENEILKTISSLTRNKSSGIDNVVPDIFIDAKHFISPFLVKLFNTIFESGIYPESWTKGTIVPIYKKGDPTNHSNYRGITLINSMAKLFSLCLRKGLNEWCENENVLNDIQFGFRDKRNTVDCVFILHNFTQNVFCNKNKLYCALIDYEKCFDTITRDSLWTKLVEIGVSCKFVNIVKSLY
jgi:hypothetical protein